MPQDGRAGDDGTFKLVLGLRKFNRLTGAGTWLYPHVAMQMLIAWPLRLCWCTHIIWRRHWPEPEWFSRRQQAGRANQHERCLQDTQI